MSLADDIAAAYRAGDYGQVQNWINSSGATASDIQSQFGLNSADMSWLTNNIGLNIPGSSMVNPAPSPFGSSGPSTQAAPIPGPNDAAAPLQTQAWSALPNTSSNGFVGPTAPSSVSTNNPMTNAWQRAEQTKDYSGFGYGLRDSGMSWDQIKSQYGLSDADMAYMQSRPGMSKFMPSAPTAPNTPAPAPAATTGPIAPSWLTGANQWLQGNTGASGGSYYDQASNKYLMPVYGQGGYNAGTGDYSSGALTGWRAYDRLPGNDSTQYSNTPFTEFDATGKQTGTGVFGEIGGTDWLDKLVMAGLVVGSGGVLGGALGLLPASPGLLGSGGAAAGGAGAGTTAAGAGGSSGLYSLSGAGTGATGGLGLSGTAGGLGLTTGGTTGLGSLTAGQVLGGAGAVAGAAGLGGGSSGTGFNVSPGSGLNLFNSMGSGLGLKVTAGDGLNLIKEVGGGLGLKLTPELVSNWSTIGKSLEGLGVDEAITRLKNAGLLGSSTTGTGTGSGSNVTINNNNGGGAGFSGLAELLAGLYSGYSKNQTATEQRAWLDKQMTDIDKLYAPGTPEYNLLQQEMERKDAAAGRNSQYGVRATDMAAKIAETKARLKAQLAGSLQGSVMSSTQNGNETLAGLFAALGKTGTSGVTNLSSILNSVLR